MERSRRRIERSKLSFFNKTNDMNQKMKRRSLLCETIDRDSSDESEEEFSDHDKSSYDDSTTSEKEIKSDVIQESSKKERKEDIQRRESISVIEKEKLLATICEIQSIKNHLVDSFAKMKEGELQRLRAEKVRRKTSRLWSKAEVEEMDYDIRKLEKELNIKCSSENTEEKNLDQLSNVTEDVNSQNVNSQDVNSQDVNSQDVNSQGVNCKDVNCKDVNCKDEVFFPDDEEKDCT